MDREAALKKMKLLKTKAKAARKAGKRDVSMMFRRGEKRLSRALRATAPRPTKAKEEAAPAAPAPAAS